MEAITVEIKPEWRTQIVVEICQQLRETGDYAAGLPILADALQEAGCDETSGVLTLLRIIDPDTRYGEVLVGLIQCDETKQAVKWIQDLAVQLGDSYGEESWDSDNPNRTVTQEMNYTVLMNTAEEYLESGECLTQYGAQDWQDILYDNIEQFWKNYTLVTGKPAVCKNPNSWEKDGPSGFIGCSC